jgi:uncharacterized protein (TIGR02466 family)
MKYILAPIFPLPVGKFSKVPITKKDRKTLLDIRDYHNNVGNIASNDSYVLNKTKSLKTTIEECIREFVKRTYAPKNDIQFPISQSWMNVTGKDMYHHIHKHPNSFFSGVFYLKTIPNDRIEFQSEDIFSAMFDIENYNEFNCKMQWVNIEKHDLLLFRSSLSHNVPVNKTTDDRISLSFNTWVSGTVGKEQDKTEVISAGIV